MSTIGEIKDSVNKLTSLEKYQESFMAKLRNCKCETTANEYLNGDKYTYCRDCGKTAKIKEARIAN